MRMSKWNWMAVSILVTTLVSSCSGGGADKYRQPLGERASLGFKSSPQLVHTLEISRSAPQAWSARFSRGAPLVSGEDPSWQIDSLVNPQGHPFKDRVAFQGRIDHLLQTLTTLTIVGPAPRGTLASLGLQPPLASLRWQTEDRTFEVSLGEVQSDGTQVCHSPEWREPQMCRGAALEMMAQVERLDQMRLPTWATFDAENVKEIEIRKAGQTEFRAKREGANWVARGKKIEFKDSLERLTHARIRQFLEEEGKKDDRALQAATELVFHHEAGDSTRLKIGSRGGKVIGTNSARPDGTFELHPETAKLIQKLAQP